MTNFINLKIAESNRNLDISFGVTKFPDRKMPCVYYQEGVMITPLAYFRNEACATKFSEILDLVFKATQK